jgi:hypothetical protein
MPVLILADAIKILDIVDMEHPEFVDGADVARVENLVVTNTDDIVAGLDVLNGIMLDGQDESRAA